MTTQQLPAIGDKCRNGNKETLRVIEVREVGPGETTVRYVRDAMPSVYYVCTLSEWERWVRVYGAVR